MTLRIRMTIAAIAVLTSPAAHADSWTDKITLGGDFRFRTETIKEQGGVASVDGEPHAYYRNALRVRLTTNAKINEMADVKVRLATGTSTQSGVTSSMIAEETPEKKNIFVDFAYAELRPADGLTLWFGKSVNPYFFAGKSEMMYSADVTFEGASAKWMGDMGMMKPFIVAGAHWLQQRTPSSTDVTVPSAGLLALQAGSMLTMDKMFLNIAAAYFNNTNMQNQGFKTDGTSALPYSATSAKGNTLTKGVGSGKYANNFYLFNAGLELGMNDCVAGMPASVYFDYVNNSVARGQINSGYTAGLNIGQLKKKGDFMVGYFFREVRADAAIGVFTDSSFGGGGTNVAGHSVAAGWQVMDNTNVQAIYYGTRKNAFAIDDYDDTNTNARLKPLHYERTMINANMMF